MANTTDTAALQLKALQGMGSKLPGIDNATMQLKQAMSQTSRAQGAGGSVSPEQAAQIGLAATQQAVGTQLTAQQEQAANKQALGQIGLQQQQQANALDLNQKQRALEKQNAEHTQRLQKLSGKLSQQLHDDTVQFKKDDLGRVTLNQKQMLDYAALQARNSEEFENYRQLQTKMVQRKQAIMKQAYAVIAQKLQESTASAMQTETQKWTAEQQKKDQELKLFLAEAKRKAQEKQAQADREAQQAAGWEGIAGSALGVLNAVLPEVGVPLSAAYLGYKAYKAS